MADIIYNSFKEYLGDGTVDMDDDVFKIALLTSDYTPDAAHTSYSDISADEVSGDGYTAGGATLAGVSWTSADGTATFDADDPEWTSATFTARYAAIYDYTAANDALVKLFDFGGDKSVSNGTFSIQFNESGVITLT